MNLSLRLANYIARYAPSRARVVAYLEKKRCPQPEALLMTCGYDEEMMLSMWMRTLVARGKSQREIERKLREKQFPDELIARTLE